MSGNNRNASISKFWEYDNRIARRWNVDPILKVSESPYVTFSCNPVWKVDPDGDDDYTVNKKGMITLLRENKNDPNDRLYSVYKNGKLDYDRKGNLISPSMSISKGILSNRYDYEEHESSKGWRLDFGDKTGEAKAVFNFLADNSKVEYGLLEYQSSGNPMHSSIYTNNEVREDRALLEHSILLRMERP